MFEDLLEKEDWADPEEREDVTQIARHKSCGIVQKDAAKHPPETQQ